MGARGGPKQAGSAVEALEVLHMVDDGLLGCARVSGADGSVDGVALGDHALAVEQRHDELVERGLDHAVQGGKRQAEHSVVC